ncbi:voltage-dependent T-type calcium channel subunit alpha-1I-like [Platichthys flesus]|uniref:voltage-dependent T-type calcium channel subunit alpha-1I-like n=1 Tax=Platichthys flesus TaxID=8260 RepID=UPI002DBC7AB1|nr:voltage-dependent T-type calcium channel subunit alpha-1I-like [Platichthys flesus]
MTDGEGRARFHYAECQEGQEEVQEEVRLSIPTPYRNDAPGHDDDPGGGSDEEEEEKEEIERRSSSSQEREEHEPEQDVEVGPTLGVRIRAPIRDPDCVSEEEEQQPYPALVPVAFFCLKQTTRPRNWCLRVVCNPYPFTYWKSNPVWFLCTVVGMIEVMKHMFFSSFVS